MGRCGCESRSEVGLPGLSRPRPMASLSEKDGGSNENLRLSCFSCETCEPNTLPLLFLPIPSENDRRDARESIEGLDGGSSPAGIAFDMETGGYLLLSACCCCCWYC